MATAPKSRGAAAEGMIPSARSISSSQVVEWDNGALRRADDYLAAEEPLEIRVGRHSLGVTMRTPGHDQELAAGLLLTQGVVTQRSQIAEIREAAQTKPPAQRNRIEVKLASGVRLESRLVARRGYASSACGVCGRSFLDAVRLQGIRPPNATVKFDPETLCAMPDTLRGSQAVFSRTGGLHAAGLFDAQGNLLALREDVGRHNAVDKVVGWALLEERIPLSDAALVVSGRGGFEIVQKALAAGIPLLASVSAPSSLAVQLARELHLTLVGFLRGKRFVVYSGEDRLLLATSR
jgi:FdhD protein